jgi:hypothetical protein
VQKVEASGGDVVTTAKGIAWIRFGLDRGGSPWNTERFQDLLRYLKSTNIPFFLESEIGMDLVEWQLLGHCRELVGLNLSMVTLTNGRLKYLADHEKLRVILLGSSRATSEELTTLAKMPALERIDISNTAANDETASQLSRLPVLKDLDLGYTQVTDESMSALARMPKLKSLGLNDLPITDEGLVELSRIQHFDALVLTGTKVTLDGIKDLLNATSVEEIRADTSIFVGPDFQLLKNSHPRTRFN